ncbi:MAG TPA: hypothetical protein VFE32_14255 [Puia sp.]|nr:hypothetical protein [Puia sp.]
MNWIKSLFMRHSFTKPKDVVEDKPTRAEHHHGSTTQGGSNYGQGSLDIGRKKYEQGSESNEGSNYGNERRLAEGDGRD